MSPITLGFEVHYYLVLFSVLLHLSFNSTFTSWITTCLSSVTFEIMVNGGKSESFTPSKGLRQGDPLSFYLFILGQEVLSRLLDHEVRTKNISGIKASSRGSTITHVMYADDTILFSKATSKDTTSMWYLRSTVLGLGKELATANQRFSSLSTLIPLTVDTSKKSCNSKF